MTSATARKTQSQQTAQPSRQVTIVGAGLGGLMMAIRLARRGQSVAVYERRCNVDQLSDKQRSFTLTISKRGQQALAEIDLLEEALNLCIGLGGRMVHGRNGSITYVPYGKSAAEQLHAIRRHDMNALLYKAACRYPNITCHFNQRLVQVEKDRGRLWFQDEAYPEQPVLAVDSQFTIGCDGIFSVVRQQIQKGERADYHQDCLDWGYKDLLVPAGLDGQHQMAANALHIWPRGHCTFFAFPTIDGAFAGNLIMPFALAETLTTVEAATALFAAEFPDLLAIAPTLPHHLVNLPMSHFITTTTVPWFFGEQIVLLGDAVHGVTPFWGEGMNAAFEDSSVLDRYLATMPEQPAAAFARFQAERKPNTDLLADLAKQNFVELRDGSGTLPIMARKIVEQWLYQLFPTWWLPLNIMISHRLLSYQEAVARYARQRRRARYFGIDLLIYLLVVWLALGRLVQRIGRWGNSTQPPTEARFGNHPAKRAETLG